MTQEKENTVTQMQIRVEEELKQRFEVAAKERGMGLSAYVRWACISWTDQVEKEKQEGSR